MSPARTPLAFAVAAVAVFFAAVSWAAVKPNPHAALECGFCHLDTPRFGVDTVKTVNFWRSEGDEPQLCERCHDPEVNFHPLGVTPNRQSRETRLYRFLPLGKSEAVRDQVVCVSCHYIHAANADHALLRGFPGSVEPGLLANWQELCRVCHGRGLEKRSPHGGSVRPCAYCHSARPQPGRPATLTPTDHRLCEFCHGLKSAEHYAGINPFKESQDCNGCHGAHLGQDRPALLKTDYYAPIRDLPALNPHRRRTACFACHADGRPAPLQGSAAVAICQRCHDSGKIAGMSHPMNKVPAGYVTPREWPLSDGALTCLSCHVAGHPPGSIAGRGDEPVAGRYLLRGADGGLRAAVCFRCHAENQWAGRNPHTEIAQKQTGCSLCHAADPEDGDTESFVAGINILCLRCHDDTDHPVGIRHTVTLKTGMEIPGSMPLGTGRRITCATCHDPHLEFADGHRLRGAKELSVFCTSCHKI